MKTIIAPYFDINITNSYFLSIQIMRSSISFCIIDPISNEYIALDTVSVLPNKNEFDTLSNEFINNELLSHDYQKVFVLYYTKEYTLVPQSLYNEEKKDIYLDFCLEKSNDNQSIYTNKIKMADSICLFNMPNDIVELIINKYKKVSFFCQIAPFIETSLLSAANSNYNVHVNVQKIHFDIIVCKGNHLKLYNTFKFYSSEEFIYYILFVFDQLKLDAKETNIFLSGKISKTNELFLLIKKYIKQVEITKTTKHFKFANIFKNKELQDYINLFNIYICV